MDPDGNGENPPFSVGCDMTQGGWTIIYEENFELVGFSCWNTQADGNGTDMAEGSTFNIGAADVTLYAKWEIDSSGWHDGTGNPIPLNNEARCIENLGTTILGGRYFLGRDNDAVQTFNLLEIPHSEVLVNMDFYAFDTWDGEAGYVEVDSVRLFQFNHDQDFATVDLCGRGNLDRDVEKVEIQTAHTNNDVTVLMSTSLNQSNDDESFGVDNIVIKIK